jgi:hypothetical protein
MNVTAVRMSLTSDLDGAELLQMSKDYNVHIAVTRRPLSLQVEGCKASLDALSEHIAAVKNVKYFICFTQHGHESYSFDRPLSKKPSSYL